MSAHAKTAPQFEGCPLKERQPGRVQEVVIDVLVNEAKEITFGIYLKEGVADQFLVLPAKDIERVCLQGSHEEEIRVDPSAEAHADELDPEAVRKGSGAPCLLVKEQGTSRENFLRVG